MTFFRIRSFLVQNTSKITSLATSGRILCARKLFDELLHRDTVAWNAMISGYSHLGLYQESLSLYRDMRFSNIKPDHFTFTAVLSVSACITDLHYGLKVHSLITVSGYASLLPINNALIDMYGKCQSAENASRVFEYMGQKNEISWCSLLYAYVTCGYFDVACSILDYMPRRMVVAWNTVIIGYSKCGAVELCIDLCKKMLEDDCRPDQWTLSSVMKVCAETNERHCGQMIHSFIIQNGWDWAVEVKNSVLSFYSKFAETSEVLKAIEVVGMLSKVSCNAVIDAHMRIGNVGEAILVFKSMPEKNLVTYTSMISGFARNGEGERAVGIFIDMKRCQFHPDDVTYGAVLHACSNLSTLSHGKMIHGCVVQFGFHSHVYIGNGLANMYAKGGDIIDSYRVFNDVLQKDLVSWNTMLFAFGLHGCSSQVFQVLEDMTSSRIKPDKVTFIGLLMTYSHLGLINEGLALFESMNSHYGIPPESDHVACVVDMLGRGGRFEEARKLANEHLGNIKEKINSLETLFGSCSVQGDITSAEFGEQLMMLRPHDDMSYVLLSNLYCASGKWKQAQIVRKAMSDQGVKKMPGCSWIEIRNRVTSFVAGSSSLSHLEVNMMLHILESEMRCARHIFLWDGIT